MRIQIAHEHAKIDSHTIVSRGIAKTIAEMRGSLSIKIIFLGYSVRITTSNLIHRIG